MLEHRIVTDSLDKVADVFEMFRDGRVSATVVGVNLRKHAADLKAFDQATADGLNTFAAAVEAIDAASSKKAWGRVGDVEDRFDAWRKKVEARLQADAEEARRREDAAIAAAKRGETPTVAGVEPAPPPEEEQEDDEALKAAMAEIEALIDEEPGAAAGEGGTASPEPQASGSDTDDDAHMTVEDIDKILEDTRKDL